MPKRKKRVRLPNGYGSVCYLGPGRRRPYGVYPPARERVEGKTVRPKAIGYAETYEEAREMLALYHRGLDLPDSRLIPKAGPTFAEVYEAYFADKYQNPARTYSESALRAQKAAFTHLAPLHGKSFTDLKYPEIQELLDDLDVGKAATTNVVVVVRGMFRYANKMGIVDKDQSAHLTVRKPDETEHGVPFTDEEIHILWEHKQDGLAKLSLMLIYSGYRIGAVKGLEINLAPDWYFRGGVKTSAGKDRIVPIHSAIQGITADLVRQGKLLAYSERHKREMLESYWEQHGIHDHTPHDCRHTFSALCERYRVPEADRKRLMGHSFGGDITNGVYGHRTVEELRESIEMIKV